jgi:hypothetical protein
MTEKPDANKDYIPLSEAEKGLASVSRRIALLHLAYSKAIIKCLGEEKGEKLISNAIKDYALKIGQKTKEEVIKNGLDPMPENFDKGTSYALPVFPGMHTSKEKIQTGGKIRFRANGCILAEVWKEYNEERLGRLYCYMDTAKYMGYNPYYKYVHIKAVPDGDDFCEFEIRPTTDQERQDFSTEDKEWFYMDK